MQPLISIALCTFNGSKYLEEQILSIVHQSHQNIEIIVVDDCSTDTTFQKVLDLAGKYPQIKPFQNVHNLGFNKNFQKAIELCTGAYIAISDQDDIWKANKLQILLDHLGENWLIFSNSIFIDENKNELDQQLLKDFKMKNRDFRSLLFYNFVTGHTTLFNRNLLEYILPIPEKGYYDWWIGFIALYHKKAVYLDETLTLHRIHSNSVMYRDAVQNESNKKQAHAQDIQTNLSLLKTYKHLKEEDRKLIEQISTARHKKYSYFLISLMTRFYQDFFPDLKKRNLISRFNFARRFSK